MNCEETRALLDAYLDQELDLVTSLRVEEHLRGCAECRQILERRETLQAALHEQPLRFAAPIGLENRVIAAIRQSKDTPEITMRAPLPRRSATPWLRQALAAACLLLVGGIIGGLFGGRPREAPKTLLTDEVIASHVRSLMAKHLFDVASTNQHNVKPWFAGNLDFSPPVLNLTDKGFPLMGGRLDYLNGHPVAALVYKRHQHWINLFVWPADLAPTPLERHSERGYNVCRWSKKGMSFAAVSDVNDTELQEFARLVAENAG